MNTAAQPGTPDSRRPDSDGTPRARQRIRPATPSGVCGFVLAENPAGCGRIRRREDPLPGSDRIRGPRVPSLAPSLPRRFRHPIHCRRSRSPAEHRPPRDGLSPRPSGPRGRARARRPSRRLPWPRAGTVARHRNVIALVEAGIGDGHLAGRSARRRPSVGPLFVGHEGSGRDR